MTKLLVAFQTGMDKDAQVDGVVVFIGYRSERLFTQILFSRIAQNKAWTDGDQINRQRTPAAKGPGTRTFVMMKDVQFDKHLNRLPDQIDAAQTLH